MADFELTAHLYAKIEQFIHEWNQHEHPFTRSTKSVVQSIAKAPAPGSLTFGYVIVTSCTKSAAGQGARPLSVGTAIGSTQLVWQQQRPRRANLLEHTTNGTFNENLSM
jgi:hypothetical protein